MPSFPKQAGNPGRDVVTSRIIRHQQIFRGMVVELIFRRANVAILTLWTSHSELVRRRTGITVTTHRDRIAPINGGTTQFLRDDTIGQMPDLPQA